MYPKKTTFDSLEAARKYLYKWMHRHNFRRIYIYQAGDEFRILFEKPEVLPWWLIRKNYRDEFETLPYTMLV